MLKFSFLKCLELRYNVNACPSFTGSQVVNLNMNKALQLCYDRFVKFTPTEEMSGRDN